MVTLRQKQIKEKLYHKIIPVVTVHSGFQQLTMEEIARLTDVSRATLYKYFSSKEDLITGIVDILIHYIEELKEPLMNDDDDSFVRSFQQIFEQSLSSVGKMSELFLIELETIYPDLHEKLIQAMDMHSQKVLKFYSIGQERGIFNPVNGRLLILQDSLLLREITNMKFVLQNQTTMNQVLLDYYQLKKIQLFKADKISIIDDTKMLPIIEKISEKKIRNFIK